MKKRVLLTIAGVLLVLLVLVVISGPVLQALGLEVFCLTSDNGRTRLVDCGGQPVLVADDNPPTLSASARPVLVDTDMAADDWMAILYLLQLPDVDVRAITVTGTGEAHCEPGTRNALDLAALAGRPEIPVACGRETPMEGDHVFPSSWRENVDALAGIDIPASPSLPASQEAAGLIARAIGEAAGELEIIALGPLTNLAEAFVANPALAQEIKQLYIMGGAFSVTGNVSSVSELAINNDVAEWNIYVDPKAAGLVLASGAPIAFVPLDASTYVLLDQEFYDRLGQDRTTPEAEFVYQVLTENIGFVRSGRYYFWDPLTAALAIDESLGTFETREVSVIQEDGPQSGATRLDEDGIPARIATAADEERFKQHFLDVLNGRVGK